jgi:organic anion transporter 5A
LASLGVMFFGIFLLGFSAAMYWSFGMPYIDDNSKKGDSPIQVAVSMASRVLGPTIGYFLGTFCLKVYVKPGNNPGFHEGDPR